MPQRIPTPPEYAPTETQTGRPNLSLIFGLAWLAATLAVLAKGFHLAMFVAPVEATMGNVYRIFYYHVPNAMLGLIFPYINFGASVAYLFLRRRNPLSALTADALALASAEVTVVFVSICLATGMLWGRAVWGIWWTWDARLTSLLLLWLLYVAYLVTRRMSLSGETPVVGAVISVFAAIDVPIVYMSIQWWRTQHPAPVLSGEGSLDSTMWPALLWNLAGWGMWGCLILAFRFALERRRQLQAQEAALAVLEASIESDFGELRLKDRKEPPNAL